MDQDDKPIRSHAKPKHSTLDYIALSSFVGGGILSAFTVCNNIRTKFYHAFVEGHGESRTPFSDILKKYNGNPGVQVMPREETLKFGHYEADGLFDDISMRLNQKRVDNTFPKDDVKTYLADRAKLTREFRTEINDRIKTVFNIESDGVKGWTIGNVQRWKMLGHNSRRESSLAFASILALGIGAATILRHSKNTLDRIETDLDEQRRAER
jgi:hypothetical protein